MIFRPELARQVRAGTKTQTRRLANNGPCRYREGKTYAVQPGRGQAAVCRIHLNTVHTATLGEITYPDARAEGFRSTDDFKTYWVALHDSKWLEREHALLDQAENDDGVTLDRDTWIARRSLDRFDTHHAHKPVWVLSFHLDTTQEPRFLARRSDQLYTHIPALGLNHEPEAVDEATQSRITQEAGLTVAHWQAKERAMRDRDRAKLSREDQISRIRRAARLRSIDASREIWALEKMLPTATDDRFVAKAQKVEARVFQEAA